MGIIDRFRRILASADDPAAEESPARPMISCHDALERVQEFLDGELEGATLDDVKAHFDVCGQCYPHLRLEESYREVVRRAGCCTEAPQALRDRVASLLAEERGEG